VRNKFLPAIRLDKSPVRISRMVAANAASFLLVIEL
jgi:hypothetical protein